MRQYLIAVVFLIAGSWLSLVGGFIFGTFKGTIVIFIAAFIGAQISFLLSRYYLKEWTIKKISNNKSILNLEKKISNEGLKIVILSRLSPLFPFGILNYLYGVTKISWNHYSIGLFAILPGTFLYSSIGSLSLKKSNIL